MTIRARLIALMMLLQLGSLALLTGGILFAVRSDGRKQVAAAEELLRHAVARTALDALIQRDEVQLLSYLNFLKGQYPALSWARVSWIKGDKTSRHSLGSATADPEIRELRVVVADPSQPDRSAEVVFGADRRVLRAPIDESARRLRRILLVAGLATLLVSLAAAAAFAHGLATPLARLTSLADTIGEGRLGARLEHASDDEVGRLAAAFNAMSSRLEASEEARRDFTSSVTHELRTPLGAIESFLPLIDAKAASGDVAGAREHLARVQANIGRLSGFVNDLLDVAQIERGRMECALSPIDAVAVIRDACQAFEAKAASQGVALEFRADALPPLMADAGRLRQVLVNLLSNALKFSSAGGRVEVAAEQVRRGEERFVEISVADDGRGMSEQDLARLFRPFSQGTNLAGGSAGDKGTGLGLYIVKSIVDQHAGRVEVTSAPGKGTKVVVSIPLAA